MRPAGLKVQKDVGVRDPIRGARRGTAGRWCNDRLNPPGSIVPKIGNNSSRCWRLREFVWVGGCVTALATWASPPGRRHRSVHKSVEMASRRRFGAFVYTVATRGSFERPWGRRSVHRLAKMAPRCYFGAFVYTVATRVAIRIATRAAPGGTSASATMACRWRPLAGPSRLVGKTDSARVAPLPGWHLRQGVNPHEPPKSPMLLRIRKSAVPG